MSESATRQPRRPGGGERDLAVDAAPEPAPREAEPSTGSVGSLSHGQRALWFLHQLAPAGSAYNIAAAARVLSPLEPAALERAAQALVDRHAALRTTFPAGSSSSSSSGDGGEPRQRVAEHLTFRLDREDVTGWSAARLRSRLAEEAWRPFDLESGPLLRLSLWTGGPGGPVLLLVIHHIVADFWSLAVLTRELAALYREASGGGAAGLGAVGLAYEEHVWLEAEALRNGRGAEQLAYWRERLSGLPALALATDRPRPAIQTYHGGSHRLRLPGELAAALRALSRSRHGTLFMTLLAAFQALLGRHTGAAAQEDLAVGSPRANRSQSKFAGTVGYFVNLVVLRADLSGEPGFVELLERTKATVAADFAHGEYPLPLLAEHLQPERDASRTPLFQVSFVLQKETRGVEGLTAFALGEEGVEVGSADLRLSSLALEGPPAPFDLQLHAVERQGGLSLALQYNSDLFDATTAARLTERFAALLAAVVADPRTPVAELALLPEAERHQLLLAWNDTPPGATTLAAEASGASLFDLFAAQAARTLAALALVAGGERLSYGELAARTAALARHLAGLGVGPEVPVAIFLPRRAELVVALLATHAAGGFYVPLDPAYPAERVAFMLADSNAAVVLTTAELAGRLPEHAARVVRLDALEDLHAPAAAGPVEMATTAGPDNLAYLIYTSGSTGRPKGVAIEHRSAVALLVWAAAVFPPEDLAGVLASTSVTFDLSVFELFLPLATGGAVFLADNALELPGLAAADEVRLINTVPSAIGALVRAGGLPPGVRTVNLAGEPLKRALADQIHALPGVEAVYNLYGPSEDTTYSAFVRVPRGEAAEPTIGVPIAGTRAHVLDRFLRLLPAGVPGELCLGGEGLARGYLGRPEITAERFAPDPFFGSGERLYRTGDLARWRPDGELEFLGRLDHQVKIRGFRIELGEIEAALLAPLVSQGKIREAVVLAREDVPGEPRLVAYVAPELPARFDRELRERLGKRLPDYMLPAAFVVLPALPLTPNGKVDRKALPAPEWAAEVGWVGPRTPSEELLAGIWSEVLGIPGIGVHDDFFALGGHSLLATRVVSRVREVLGVELPLRRLFEVPTVAELARRIEGSTQSEAPPLVQVARDQPLPLSFAQQRLWFLDQLEPGSAAYNIPAAVELRGRVDRAALAASLSEVARRHESLRTRFAGDRQVIAPPAPLPLPAVDLAGLPAALGAAEARRLARAEALRPFDLAAGPLLRSTLVNFRAEDQVLLLTMHHVVSDGWSLRLLAGELGEIYGAYSRGLPSPLPELPIQYADYAVWQRRWLQGEVLTGELAHWRGRLAGAPPVLELPLDRPRAAAVSDRGGSRALSLPPSLLAALQALARRQGVTLFMAVLAAFQALLSRISHAEDVSVGTPVAGRNQLATENLIGFFVNTLVLRTDLSGEPAFGELLGRVRAVALAAYAHQELPFEKLVEELQPRRDLGVSPLFQVSFALDAEAPPALRLGDLTGSLWPPVAETEKFDLSLTLGLLEDRLAGTFGFRAELFDGVTIERLAGGLVRLLAGAVAAPETPLSRLPLWSAAERHQALVEWSGAVPSAPVDLLVHERVERWARETPDAAAVVWDEAGAEARLTYGELNRRANLLARRLRALGIGPESPVALGLERSPELVTAALAVLKAGAAYLPLDPEYPAERLRYILDDSGAAALLTVRGLAGRFEAPAELPVLLLDEAVPAGAPLAIARGGAVSAESLAYVIYTSGSTGLPKGTLLRHAGLAGLARWHREAFALRPGERTTLLAGPGFDAAVWELWSCLAAGATLCIPPRDTVVSPAALAAWLAERQIAVSFLPTPLAEAVLEQELPADLPLRALLAGGDRLRSRPPAGAGFALYNCYGPTEGTVVATSSHVSPAGSGLPAIGRLISGARGYVVAAGAEPVGPGVSGELWLGGEGLARGYLGRPELTAERFVPDPFGAEPGGRLYRTGDLVRRRADGELEFLDRLDHQVKVRGFRIELGEIEARLAALPGVREAAVLARPDARGELSLVAWVAAAVDDAGSWSAALRAMLPSYMVPSAWGVIEALPLTANGKVDRRALAALPSPLTTAEREDGATPRTPAEELVAGIFAEVLGLERVGVADSFFELGGHSLLATQLASRIREAFGVELPLRAVFEAPTVAGLAARLSEESRDPGDDLPAIPRASGEERGVLSFAQARLWFLDQLEPGSPMYNLPAAVALAGALDRAAFAAALGEIVRRHEVLRTVFRGAAGEPVAVVSPAAGIALPVIDLATLPPAGRREEAARLSAEEARRPFDLAADPLLRVSLLALGATEHVALVTLHHIASDGWSIGVLARELAALYGAFRAGVASPLPELAIQYADYAVWQRRRLAGQRLEAELAWWERELAGIPPALDLPTDRPRPAMRSPRGAVAGFAIDGEALAGISALSRQRGTTLFMTLLAGFAALLQRHAGADDVVVGTPIAGRLRAETEGLIGLFVNTLVLRTDLSGSPDLVTLLARVRETTLAAYAHQEVPFERLIERVTPERDLSRPPLVQVLFSLQNAPAGPLVLPDLALAVSEVATGTAKFELSCTLTETAGGLSGVIEYSRDLFERATAERLADHFARLLAGGVAEPRQRLAELPMLSPAEWNQLLVEHNDVGALPVSSATLHELFAAQVARTPEAVALVAGISGERWTYRELDLRAEELALRLAALGVGPEVRVGVCLTRTPLLVAALLAVLKAGGAYVPLDPDYPAERLAFMLADSAAAVLVTEPALVASLPSHAATLIVDPDAPDSHGMPAAGRVASGAVPGNLAYLIYTSGSTGRPKGVAIEHRSAVAFALWARTVFSAADLAGVLASTSVSFDLSVFELFVTLAWGGRWCLPPTPSSSHGWRPATRWCWSIRSPRRWRSWCGRARCRRRCARSTWRASR